ncbi:MAG: SDR family oxidoreductase [Microbacterium sp.]
MAEIVVVGGTGQIGAKVADLLRRQGRSVCAASPSTGVDTLDPATLGAALDGARIVIDVSKPRTYDPRAMHEFFTTGTGNLLRAERGLGIRHHVALTIVGSGRPHDIAFYRGKAAAEQLVRDGGVPYSLVHATQFFEFAPQIAANAGAEADGTILLPDALVQPAAGSDVAAAVAGIALDAPLQADVDLAGPEPMPLAVFVERVLRARGDDRPVRSDPAGRYFGGSLGPDTLLPGGDARLLPTRLDEWLAAPA